MPAVGRLEKGSVMNERYIAVVMLLGMGAALALIFWATARWTSVRFFKQEFGFSPKLLKEEAFRMMAIGHVRELRDQWYETIAGLKEVLNTWETWGELRTAMERVEGAINLNHDASESLERFAPETRDALKEIRQGR